jgi:hypothetical protein
MERMILRKELPSNLVVVSSDFLENPYTKDGLNVVGDTPRISTARPGQAPRAPGEGFAGWAGFTMSHYQRGGTRATSISFH